MFQFISGHILKLIVFFQCIFLTSWPLSDVDPRIYFAVWNVGQGQWVTVISPDSCFHFDMGGDRPVQTQLLHKCKHVKNYLYITHADLDHVSFIRKHVRKLKNLCLASQQPIDDQNIHQWGLLPLCRSKPKWLTELTPELKFKDSNSNSKVWLLEINETTILISGDSTEKSEKIWTPRFITKTSQNSVRHGLNIPMTTLKQHLIYVVGHHGSKTSSSDLLLRSFKNQFHLTTAIVSARKKRYGHPHRDIVERFQSHQIPLIKTESYKNVVFQLN